jgi:hypothetical protein
VGPSKGGFVQRGRLFVKNVVPTVSSGTALPLVLLGRNLVLTVAGYN